MRRLLLSCLLLLVFIPPWSREPRLVLMHPGAGEIRVKRVPLDATDPRRRVLGPLTYLGGAALTSPDDAFGGFSAIAVDGDRFTLLSDGGGIARFRMDRRWRVSDVRFADLPAGPGSGWEKADRDSEALAIDPAGDTAWVAFENHNAIWRYSADLSRATGSVTPPLMAWWPFNGGAESLIRLHGGRFLALGEDDGGKRRPWIAGVMFSGDPTSYATFALPFRLDVPRGWSVSDAAQLPDGRLIILLRRLEQRGFRSALAIAPQPAPWMRRRRARARMIAAWGKPLVHDNFEGIAVTQEGDRTILWLISDDNFFPLQRTLLLKFALDDPYDDRGWTGGPPAR